MVRAPIAGDPEHHHRRHRLLRSRQRQPQQAVQDQGHQHLLRPPAVVRLPVRQRESTRRSTIAPARPSRPPTAAPPRRERQVDILADVNFGTIYRVIRANYNTGRETDQKYYNFFVQDSWKVSDRLTVNPGLRYEQQSLSGTLVQDFELKNNWAPRVGVIYDVLGNGRSKLYANYGVFYARIPNDLAARALSADDGVQRADYFDAGLTRPIPNGVATQVRRRRRDHAAPARCGRRRRRHRSGCEAVVQGRVRVRLRVRSGLEHQPRRPLHPPHHRPRARRRRGGADGRLRAGTARDRDGRVHPDQSEPRHSDHRAAAGRVVRGSDPQLRRGRADARSTVLGQVAGHRVVPLVAPERHVRGLLPRRQRPVGPGHHVALRLPDQRPELHRRSVVRSSATLATSASSASSARARCRSIVRTSSSSTATTPRPTTSASASRSTPAPASR